MALNLEEVLKKLGWSDGFQIPIANAENKALEEELAKLSLRKQKSKTTLDIVSGRLESLNDHFKYVNQENDQTQKLITAHRQQLDNLEDTFHLTKAENQTAQRDIRNSSTQLNEAVETQEKRKNELEKLLLKAEGLKAEMDWDCEALKAWEEALKKRDDDIDLLKKFFNEDDRRFNQLEAKRQHLRTELITMRDKIAKMAADSHNCEQIIERSGKVIKQLSIERDALISQWKDTVKMLQQRDNDIMRTQEQITHMHEVLQKQEEKLETENNFLNNELKNNQELEIEIQDSNNLSSKLRKELTDLYHYLMNSNTELHCLKRQMSSTAHELKNERLKLKRLEEQYYDKEMFCHKFHEDMEALNLKLEEVKNSAMTSEERIFKIENMIDQEEKMYNLTLVDIEKINGELYRSEQLLKDQTNIAKNLEVDINLGACASSQLRKQIQLERKDLDRVKEVVYEMEYRIDECERKLMELADAKNAEVPEEVQQKLDELEQSLTENKEIQQALQSQVERLREEMRRLSSIISADKEVLDALQSKCENFLLVFEISQKQIAVAKKTLQEKQVEENMMKLRIHHIEKDKKKEEKQIFNLERFRLNLEQAMKERQVEINTQKQILQTKKRNLEEDKGRLKADVALRKLKIDQYQKKYHLAISGLGKDEDGQPLTVTHFKIKNAQEKFFLQQEGDELDQKIKTAEKEIVALENTLKIVNLTNASFKASLSPIKETDPAIEEMDDLQEELRQTYTELKKHRSEMTTKEAELDTVTAQLKEIEEDLSHNLEIIHTIEEEIMSVKKQEMDKEQKLKRVECELKKLYKQLKKKGKKDLYKYNRDFEIRHLQDTNKKVLSQLRDFSIAYPEMAASINKSLSDNSLELPEKRITPSTYSTLSTPMSCRSTQHNTQRTNTTNNSSVASQVPMATVNLGFGM